MALTRLYADIVERRAENGAAIVDESLHPQGNVRRVTPPAPKPPRSFKGILSLIVKPVCHCATDPFRLTMKQQAVVRSASKLLESDPQGVSRELLSETAHWSAPHFKELGRISPEALAHLATALAMAYRR